jgi:oligopeptide transport system permease protein
MILFVVRRLALSLIVLWAVATFTFILLRLLPGGPFDRERRLPAKVLANLEAKYHLDLSLPEQYARYLLDLTRGDFGPSYKYVDRNINEILKDTFPLTVELGIYALFLAVWIALLSGVLSAWFEGSLIDRGAMFFSAVGISLPAFLLGGFLIWLFSVQLPWFHLGEWDHPGSAFLPALTLGAAPAAFLARLVRAGLMETLEEDFVRTARAKGVSEWRVLWKHAFLPSLLPTLSVSGPLTATLLTGSFVVEYIFALPGMGRFFITSVTDRDYPMVMAVTLIYTALLVVANLVVDLLYPMVDPRIRVTGR